MNRPIQRFAPRLKPHQRRELHLLLLFIYLQIEPRVKEVLIGFDGVHEEGRATDGRQDHSLIWTPSIGSVSISL